LWGGGQLRHTLQFFDQLTLNSRI